MKKSAELSPCGTWRYRLERNWNGETMFARSDPLTFVMLNPSTADDTRDDPTLRRCLFFARREHASGLIVVNLAAVRSPNPIAILAVGDPIGPGNADALRRVFAQGNGSIVLAWGGLEGVRWRVAPPLALVQSLAHDHTRHLVCLGICDNGEPRHPLFVRGVQPLIPWDVGNWRAAR